ncbi:hypothetical protein STEG23_025600 [Scotinomys teguina]
MHTCASMYTSVDSINTVLDMAGLQCNSYFIRAAVGCPSVHCECVLLSLVDNKAVLDNGKACMQVETSDCGADCRVFFPRLPLLLWLKCLGTSLIICGNLHSQTGLEKGTETQERESILATNQSTQSVHVTCVLKA